MDKEKGIVHVILLLIFIVAAVSFFAFNSPIPVATPTPTATPYQFPYVAPTIAKNDSYRMVIVGDSIVATLGANANVLREYLIGYYPDSEFVTYNYGYPATNVLSLYDRLTKNTLNGLVENGPILAKEFELIIIESFGYNPLSENSLAAGLAKENEELERSVREILLQKPNAALAFLTPIAPDPVNFAKGILDLSVEQRRLWVEERVSYIDNHRRFAQEKGIPVIDVYKASLQPSGEVNRTYISDDSIHPSKAGIDLISKEIADYIFTNKIFPE